MSSNNSSKAKILLYLESKVTLFKIPKLLNFNVSVLKKDFSIIFNKIQSTFKDSMIVLRSSASDEDGKFNSAAGTYDSVLSVPANNKDNILAAIDTVIASYKKKRSLLKGDQVIIQKMVQNVNMSGVIFTHDLNTGAPYYVINYDDQSGLTNTVTSGSGQYSNRTLYVHRNKTNKIRSVRFLKLLKAVKELEKVMNNKFLDIEFVLDKDLTPFLLQVRIITTKTKWNLVSKPFIADNLFVNLLIPGNHNEFVFFNLAIAEYDPTKLPKNFNIDKELIDIIKENGKHFNPTDQNFPYDSSDVSLNMPSEEEERGVGDVSGPKINSRLLMDFIRRQQSDSTCNR